MYVPLICLLQYQDFHGVHQFTWIPCGCSDINTQIAVFEINSLISCLLMISTNSKNKILPGLLPLVSSWIRSTCILASYRWRKLAEQYVHSWSPSKWAWEPWWRFSSALDLNSSSQTVHVYGSAFRLCLLLCCCSSLMRLNDCGIRTSYSLKWQINISGKLHADHLLLAHFSHEIIYDLTTGKMSARRH